MNELVIRPKSKFVSLDFKELWAYRELFLFLAWRDVMVKYKQTAIGVVWAVIRPVLTMIVFTVIFGKVAHLPSNDIPYPLLTLSGTVPWQFFANALSESSNSVVANAQMISKVYFPRLIIPTSAILSGLVDLGISFLILMGMMAWYRITPTVNLLFLPLLVLLMIACALGIGLWFSALNVEYRDVRYIVPFLVQLGTYVSPVGFSGSVIPEKWHLLFCLNPMVGVINGFRWSLFGGKEPLDQNGLLIGALITVLLLVSGAWHFRRTEKTFADII